MTFASGRDEGGVAMVVVTVEKFSESLSTDIISLSEAGNIITGLLEHRKTISVPTRSDTNQPVQSKEQAGSLKFGIRKKRDYTV